MITFLWAALATVLIVGIPLGVIIGRASKRLHRTVNAPVGASAPTGIAPQSVTAAVNQSRKTTKFWYLNTMWFWGALTVTLLVIGFILYMLRHLWVPAGDTSEWLASFGIRIATLLLIVGIVALLLSRWAGMLIIVLGVTALAFTLLFPGAMQQIEGCAPFGCGPRAGEFPTINGGTVNVARGGVETFYAVGRVALRNHIDHCLNISPKGVFHITWTDDARIYFIEAKSGVKELTTVTSLYIGEMDCT